MHTEAEMYLGMEWLRTHLGSTCDGPNMLRKLHIGGSLADKAHSRTIARTAFLKQIKTLGRSFWLGSASQGPPLQFSRRESKVGFDFGEVSVIPSTLSCPRIYGVCSRMYQAVQLAWCAATLLSEGTRLHSFYSRVSRLLWWRCCISCTTCVHLAQVKSHIMAAAPLPNTSEPPAKRARKHAILKSLVCFV